MAIFSKALAINKGKWGKLKPWKADAAAISHQGNIRSCNQDAVLCKAEKGVFCVADGMGGEAHGEIASTIAVKHIEALSNESYMLRRNDLKSAFRNAAAEIFSQSQELEVRMGTTAAALYVKLWTGGVFTAHIGDSRIYVFRDGRLHLLTADDSYARKAGFHPHDEVPDIIKGKLTNYLGRDEVPVLHTRSFNCRNNDLFLLCSDGLLEHCAREDIQSVLSNSSEMSVHDLCNSLVGMALKRGGKDNISVVIGKLSLARPWRFMWGRQYLIALAILLFATTSFGLVFFSCSSDNYAANLNDAKAIYRNVAAAKLTDKKGVSTLVKDMEQLLQLKKEVPDFTEKSVKGEKIVDKTWNLALRRLRESTEIRVANRDWGSLGKFDRQRMVQLLESAPPDIKDRHQALVKFWHSDMAYMETLWMRIVRLAYSADSQTALRTAVREYADAVSGIYEEDPLFECLNENDARLQATVKRVLQLDAEGDNQ